MLRAVSGVVMLGLIGAAFVAGGWQAATSKAALATPFTDALARHQREADWLLLRDLGPDVRQGDEGWLFLADELRVHPQREADAKARAAALIDIHRTLAAKNIALLVVVVPDKSRIEAAHLGLLKRPPQIEARVREWTAALEAGGVPALDLAPVLEAAPPSPFLRTDTHWNEEGSVRAAGAVAAKLQRLHAEPGTPVASVVTSREHSQAWGDLVHLAGIDGLPIALKPKPDEVWTSQVETHSDSTDLFGDAGLPSTVLLGTSFSRRSNFMPFLQLACGAQIADFALDGGDFHGAAQRYFAGDAFRDHAPRTIVWEMPERALQAPLGDAERAWLRKPL